jgi:hypothetical protein
MGMLAVSAVMIGHLTLSNASYPQITSFEYINSYYVELQTDGGPFPTFWFLDQEHNSTYNGDYSVNTYPGVTNIAVYVYNEYPGAYYSYAIIDSVQGTTIWNGP